MKINWEVTALRMSHNINTHSSLMNRAIMRLSSGRRINSAADDPAGFCIAQGMESQIRGMNVAKRNAQDGISMLQTADGALSSVQQMLQKLNELAVQAANGSYTNDDRERSNIEFQSLIKGIDDICAQSQFNTQNLFDGDDVVRIQVGANKGQYMDITKKQINKSTLGLDTLDISTQDGASDAITAVKNAIKKVSNHRSVIGAEENRLEYTIDYLDNSVLNLTEAQSRITDADMAKEMMNYAKESLLSQVSNYLLSSYLKQQESMIQMLLSMNQR